MNRICENVLRANLRNIQCTPRQNVNQIIQSHQNSINLHTSSKHWRSSMKDKYNRRVTRRVIRSQEKTTKQFKWPKLSKILTPQNIVPKSIQPPPNLKQLLHPASAPKESQSMARRKLKQWLKDNAGVIILNLGSIASFLSFTRTDILELRLLSITGSLSSIVYFVSRPPPLVLGPVIWSSIFAATNAYMVYHIYEERKGKPSQLTSQEEDVYEEHFLPHGVTPRQFEKMIHIAKKRELNRGDVLIQKGQKMNTVHLVISGSTEAVTSMSRRVTAASSSIGNKDTLVGGDAGAWVGELAFLDYLSIRDRSSGVLKPPLPPFEALTEDVTKNPPLATAATPSDKDETNSKTQNLTLRSSKTAVTQNSILTYIATQDSVLYEWDFEELGDLMKTSTDLRSSVTRTMTAAVVGKVVNMYISKADADQPTWKNWLAGQSSTSASSNISTVRVNISQE